MVPSNVLEVFWQFYVIPGPFIPVHRCGDVCRCTIKCDSSMSFPDEG